MRRVVPLLLTGLLLSSLVSGAGPSSADAGDRSLAVTGYALDGIKPSLLTQEAPALRTVGVDGVTLTADGTDVTRPSEAAGEVVATAHDNGLRAELLVSNFSGDDFSPKVAHKMLGSEDNRDHVAAVLADQVGPGGFDGIAVDLESLQARDIDGLTAFVRTLRERLPAGASISIDLMASTTTQGYADGGYDLEALAGIVDVVALMAYDQHGPWSKPGPVGSLAWQRKAVAALLAKVPAEQVDLGVAGYGYYWSKSGKAGPMSPRKARSWVSTAGARAVWSRTTGEWSAVLPNGTRLAWSDRKSWNKRVALADELGLHGLALWRLGLADSLV